MFSSKKNTDATIDVFEYERNAIAIQLNKFFDRGQIVLGKMPWDGGEMIVFPCCILYPIDRANYFAESGIENIPVELKFQYAMHYAFALNPDDEIRGRESALLTATVEQLVNLVDGTPDEANNSTFRITVRHHVATPEITLACLALNEGRLKKLKNAKK